MCLDFRGKILDILGHDGELRLLSGDASCAGPPLVVIVMNTPSRHATGVARRLANIGSDEGTRMVSLAWSREIHDVTQLGLADPQPGSFLRRVWATWDPAPGAIAQAEDR